MYEKYLNVAKAAKAKARDLQKYAQDEIAQSVFHYRRVVEDIYGNPKIKNRVDRERQARHMISLALLQKLGAVKDEYREALEDVVISAKSAIDAIPEPTPAEVQKYRDMINDLRTDLLFTIKFEEKEGKVERFIGAIDNPFLAVELRREFGSISRDLFHGMEGDQTAAVTIRFKQYYDRLKDGIEFYPAEVSETVKLGRQATAELNEDKLLNGVYVDTYASQILTSDLLPHIENPDAYFETVHPELMEENLSEKIDAAIKHVLTPSTEQTEREAVSKVFTGVVNSRQVR